MGDREPKNFAIFKAHVIQDIDGLRYLHSSYLTWLASTGLGNIAYIAKCFCITPSV